MTREEAIEKVRKILRFKDKAGTGEEAISNILIAQRIMAKYDIDETEMEEGGDQEELVAIESFDEKYRSCRWKYILAETLAPNYRCKVFVSKSKGSVVFLGYYADVQICTSVYEYLLSTGTVLAFREFRRYKTEGKSASGVKNTYYAGFINGIATALSKQCTALMLVVPQEVEKEFSKIANSFQAEKAKIIGTSDRKVYNKGFDDGKNAVIARNLEVDQNVHG